MAHRPRTRLIGRGRLGCSVGLPGVDPGPDGEPIEVFVFESPLLAQHWRRLDAFEGPGYRRVVVDVSTAEGVLRASIYVAADTAN